MEKLSNCEVVRRTKGSSFVLYAGLKGNYFIADSDGFGGICLFMYDHLWLPWWSRRNMAIQMYETFVIERRKWVNMLMARRELRQASRGKGVLSELQGIGLEGRGCAIADAGATAPPGAMCTPSLRTFRRKSDDDVGTMYRRKKNDETGKGERKES